MNRYDNKRRNNLFAPDFKVPERRTDRVPKQETEINRADLVRAPMDLASETRESRLKMHDLVSQGYAEYHALAMVLPSDSNRRRQLKVWQQHGLWPIQAEEMRLWRDSKRRPRETEKRSPDPDPTPPRETGQVEMVEQSDIEKLVREIVAKEVKRQFDKVAISPIPKTGKAGKRAVKKAFSLPADLWEDVEKMFAGEIMSNVVAAAIRMYIGWKKELD